VLQRRDSLRYSRPTRARVDGEGRHTPRTGVACRHGGEREDPAPAGQVRPATRRPRRHRGAGRPDEGHQRDRTRAVRDEGWGRLQATVGRARIRLVDLT